jgi:hypothetical protein
MILFRRIIYCLSFIVGLGGSKDSQNFISMFTDSESPVFIGFIVFSLLLVLISPFIGTLFIIGVQSINPMSAKQWKLPSHSSNPFNLYQPLYFIHFAGYSVVALSIGLLIGSPLHGLNTLLEGLIFLILGANIILALRLCHKVFINKFEPIRVEGEQDAGG